MLILLIGAGGHAREVVDIIRDCQANGQGIEPFGFIDENTDAHGCFIDDLPVLGDFRWFSGRDLRKFAVVCAVGSPQSCRRLAQKAQTLGLDFANVISPRACISSRAHLGHGVMIFPNVVVNAGAFIGNHVILNVGSTVSHDSRVGDFCNINPGAHLAGNVTVGEGCYIGMGANVIQQVSIDGGTTIGAGAAVISHLPSGVTAVGVPARVIKTPSNS